MPVGGPRQVTLLAFLLLHANRAVAADQLLDALWAEPTTRGAPKRVQMAIARLRKALDASGAGGDSPLRTVAGGYMLGVQSGELDADVFQARAETGRQALEAGEPARAVEVLGGALALWRGPALAEVAYEGFAQPEIRRLEELRLAALEVRFDAELRLGRHAEMIGELAALAVSHPTRERLVEQVMLALYRCGRQTEALDAYHRTRTRLAEELGLQPGPALKTLQAQILDHSPTLDRDLRAPQSASAPDAAAAFCLPAKVGDLVGRDEDATAIGELLRRPHVRLVNVTGAGGVGKTSVAIEISHRLGNAFAQGAAYVDLTVVQDPAHVDATMLQALGGMPETGATPAQSLCKLLAARHQLVVLDNFEHVLSAAPLLTELLDAAPAVKLLLTSRVALGLRVEHRYALDPLAQSPAGDRSTVADIRAAPATTLFAVRAAAHDRTFAISPDNAAAIAAVCERVGGLPLAVELAAACCSVLSVQEIARDLRSVLGALGCAPRDAPARHRSLRATLDWSHGLLDDDEQGAFACFSVFAGGCTVAAADQVAGAPLQIVERLIAHSVLHRRADRRGETRLVMLEPIREYAAERLDARPDVQEIGARHSLYYLQLSEHGERALRGREQMLWQQRLDAEADNLRRALGRERDAGNIEHVVRIAAALEFWWVHGGRSGEGRTWITDGLAAAEGKLSPLVEADGLRVAAHLGVDREPALDLAQQGAAEARAGEVLQAQLQDSLDCALAAVTLYRPGGDAVHIAHGLIQLAYLQLHADDREAAQVTAAEAISIAAQSEDDLTLGDAYKVSAEAAADFATARQIAAEAAPRLERAGDLRALTSLWDGLGWRALIEGALTEADLLFERALELQKQTGSPVDYAYTIGNRGHVAREQGDLVTAATHFATTLVLCRAHGVRRPVYETLAGLGAVAAARGDVQRAAQLAGACDATRFGQPLTALDHRMRDTILAAKRRSDDPVWSAAYAAGSQLGIEAAIDLGLTTAAALAEPDLGV